MRTTITVDDDVMAAIRALAEETGETIGTTLSSVARRGLSIREQEPIFDETYGFPQVRSEGHTGPPITLELVNRLRDEGI
jgi:hypothetical protein